MIAWRNWGNVCFIPRNLSAGRGDVTQKPNTVLAAARKIEYSIYSRCEPEMEYMEPIIWNNHVPNNCGSTIAEKSMESKYMLGGIKTQED